MGIGAKQIDVGSWESWKRWSALLAIACLGINPALAGGTYQNSYCDSFCDQLVDPSNGKVLSLTGQDGWSAADDEACALAEGATPAAPLPNSTPIPLPSTQSQDFQCEWHAGQALNYCEAYVLPQQSLGFEKVLAVLDAATAATCWTACLAPVIAPVGMACALGSTASSAIEFLDTLAQEDSATAEAVQTTLSAAGGVIGFGDFSNYLSANRSSSSGNVFNSQANNGMVSGHNGTKGNGKRNACITGAIMTVLAALRLHNIQQQEGTQQSACNSIQGLGSSTTVIGAVGATATGTGTSVAGVSTPPAGAMAQANGPLGNGKQPVSVACATNGLSGCGFSAQQLSAPDAKILDSGLAQSIAPQAAQQDPSAFLSQGSSNPGAAAGQAASAGSSNSDISKAISTLAAKAADSTANLDGPAPMSGGGGGGAVGGAQQTQAFSFGAENNSPSAGPGQTTFSQAPTQTEAPSGDIFHSGFKGSIFQIVSQKMSSVRARIDQLPWSTPLNRALAGGTDALPSSAPQGGSP